MRRIQEIAFVVGCVAVVHIAFGNGGPWVASSLPSEATFLHAGYEAFVVVVEAFVFSKFWGMNFRRALLLSFSANLVSYISAIPVGYVSLRYIKSLELHRYLKLTAFALAGGQAIVLLLNIVLEGSILRRFAKVDNLWRTVAAVNLITWVVGFTVIVLPNIRFMGKKYPSIGRIRNDHRSMTIGLEAYYVEYNSYPASESLGKYVKDTEKLKHAGATHITTVNGAMLTPKYVTAVLTTDPCAPELGAPYAYYADTNGWILFSPGVDGVYDINPAEDYTSSIPQPSAWLMTKGYDPTNGSVSRGDIFRTKQ